jgi:hypothetical protein
MKARLSFDPAHAHYGAATGAVRQILTEWASIDWFVPAQGDAAKQGVAFFEEHNFLGRLRRPDLFPERLDLRVVQGGWAEFHQLCQQVRQPRADGWDWKYSALRVLSQAHSHKYGWSMADEAGWRGAVGPRLDLGRMLPPVAAADAGFYLGYATLDALAGIEWQLAKRSDDLSGNPFLPSSAATRSAFIPSASDPRRSCSSRSAADPPADRRGG